MTVSVIIPCLKRDESVERCLAEIRRQAASGGAELDLVVIEGVSPCAKARNEGLRRATGDYIAWVDADDEILDGWWCSISQALETRPDIVTFGWHDEKSMADLTFCPSGSNPVRQLFQAVLRDDSPYSFLWNKVIRRDLWEDESFDAKWNFQEDFAILPRVLNKVRTLVTVDRPLYQYRYNPLGISQGKSLDHVREVLDVRWQRFEDWRATDYAKDALAPFVQQVVCFYSGMSGDVSLPRGQRRRLTGVMFLLLSSSMAWQIKIKAICVALGWSWPQRLVWKLHGVSP